jgi:Phosphodiester glycosidase
VASRWGAGAFQLGNTPTPGISAFGGRLVSEAVDGRTSLVLPLVREDGTDDALAGGHGPDRARRPRAAALADVLRVRASGGAARELDGLNRAPGLVRGCGGSGGDQPTEQPKHDFTCTDESELIRFDPVFGGATEPGPGAEAVLDGRGTVTAVREPRGGPIPADGSVLAATGDAVAWLRAHAAVGARVRFDEYVAGLPPLASAVNGGPRLLRRGAPAITAFAEGFHWPEDPGFYYRFGVRRNPRTLAGVERDGDLLLVAVDGRAPGHSVGASFRESAAVMDALAARDAVNLDGGGSTGMTVGGALVTRPSDPTGERPIADALLIG